MTKKQHYRLYVIQKLPWLKVLDFERIKDAERAKAHRLAVSAAGAALEGDVQLEAREAAIAANAAADSSMDENGVKTFTPGHGQSNSTKESFKVHFTKEQKVEIKNMIANARTPEEIERIEECVRRGEFPKVVS